VCVGEYRTESASRKDSEEKECGLGPVRDADSPRLQVEVQWDQIWKFSRRQN
jgi:hypothetical protein